MTISCRSLLNIYITVLPSIKVKKDKKVTLWSLKRETKASNLLCIPKNQIYTNKSAVINSYHCRNVIYQTQIISLSWKENIYHVKPNSAKKIDNNQHYTYIYHYTLFIICYMEVINLFSYVCYNNNRIIACISKPFILSSVTL